VASSQRSGFAEVGRGHGPEHHRLGGQHRVPTHHRLRLHDLLTSGHHQGNAREIFGRQITALTGENLNVVWAEF
jgi:hypothetical protein